RPVETSQDDRRVQASGQPVQHSRVTGRPRCDAFLDALPQLVPCSLPRFDYPGPADVRGVPAERPIDAVLRNRQAFTRPKLRYAYKSRLIRRKAVVAQEPCEMA